MTYDRSAVMRAVKSRDTGPEMAVRKILRPIAPGYRLHRADLPGKPDIVYAGRKLVIFVHGCFWHGHDCPRGARAPKANAEYWQAKIARNRARDLKTLAAYEAIGWRTLVIHECELKDSAALLRGGLRRRLRGGDDSLGGRVNARPLYEHEAPRRPVEAQPTGPAIASLSIAAAMIVSRAALNLRSARPEPVAHGLRPSPPLRRRRRGQGPSAARRHPPARPHPRRHRPRAGGRGGLRARRADPPGLDPLPPQQ